jgi:O-6-methylguanine DNA methyltransferase
VARVKHITREVHHGKLAVTAGFDAAGNLCSVKLPRKIPPGLDAKSLAGVIAALGKFPLALGDAPFLRRAWEKMRRIPWGRTLTYRDLAAAAGNPRASRAAGQACARNPLVLIVPCHRIVAQRGLGGFAYGLAWKTALLELERAH